jgi:hypothetical protein
MKRNTLLIVVVVIAGIFLLFDPLKYITGRNGAVTRPATSAKMVQSLQEWAQSSWKSPEDYLLSAFGSHDIVMVGEFFKIRQNVELVSGLIPRLYAAGIRSLGIEYALSDDQKRIDDLVTASSWDETAARAITFDWVPTWGYQEYIDLYKAAWRVNQSRPKGAPAFRVVGLSVRQNWEYLKSQSDGNNAEVVAKIYANGQPDAHIADVIDAELVKKGGKALVLVGTAHAMTRYHSKTYEKNAKAVKLQETRRSGVIVRDRIGDRVFCVSLHSPWPDQTQKSGLGYAAGGAIDALIDALPEDRKSGGWDLAGTPLGALSVASSSYADGGSASTLYDLFDGYITQGPVSRYAMVTPIPDFVRPQDADQANRNFPGVKPSKPMDAKALNDMIADETAQLAKAMAAFK